MEKPRVSQWGAPPSSRKKCHVWTLFVWSGGGGGGGRHAIVFSSLCFLLLALQFPLTVAECDDTSSCHPESKDLIDVTKTVRIFNVTSTCGSDGDTIYEKAQETLDTQTYTCNLTDGFNHPKQYMYDRIADTIVNIDQIDSPIIYRNPNLQTYWQSQPIGTDTEQLIVLDLADQFLVRSIDAIFLSPHVESAEISSDLRPLALVIEFLATVNGTWEARRYYADNCSEHFPDVVGSDDGSPRLYNVAVCEEKYFGGDASTDVGYGFGRQLMEFDPALEFDDFDMDPLVYAHFMAAAVRIRITVPRDHDNAPSSYVAIADLIIRGQCSCFGHAEVCSGDNEANCDCRHNTQGMNCEECMPLYNNMPWRMGHSGEANACEDCGCNGHAGACVYDAGKSSGVCTDCLMDTTGDKCEFCTPNFYVNPQVRDPNATVSAAGDSCQGFNGTYLVDYECGRWCIPCDCSMNGTVEDSYVCQNYTGQCDCKEFVMNRECDECMDEYWNLDVANVQGCQECTCAPAGTIENRRMCDKTSGECFCKNNTEGRDCDQCKVNFFELSVDNPSGCSPCLCDTGGALTAVCPDEGGFCPCRPNLGGRTCTVPTGGFFGPLLDQLTAEAEFQAGAVAQGGTFEVVERAGHGEEGATNTGLGFVTLGENVEFDFIISAPTTAPYNAVVRYESTVTWSGATLGLSLPSGSSDSVSELFECGGSNQQLGADQMQTLTIIPAAAAGGVIMGVMCLRGSTDFVVTLTLGASAPAEGTFLLDSVVLLPVLDGLAAYDNAADPSAVDICYAGAIRALPRPAAADCPRLEYSIMTEVYNGATACVCDGTGSESQVCAPVGGQCPCKPYVMLQDCSRCQVDHYGFDSGSGCTPCECDVLGSVKTACNDVAVCECKVNVTNIKCDSCISEHWGLFEGDGCQPCTCNMAFSLDNQCADRGQCNCLFGVGGLECDICADGYFNLTADGCTDCGCDADGSNAISACDKDTGTCTCKANVQGDKCDTCNQAFFGLGPWGTEGCIPCFCSGMSSNCTSAEGWYGATFDNSWDLTDDNTATQDLWTSETLAGVTCLVENKIKIENTDSQLVMRLANDTGACYFRSTLAFAGQKQGAYGRTFGVDLSYAVLGTGNAAGAGNVTYEDNPARADEGDVVLRGAHASFQLVAAFDSTPTDTRTPFQLRLHESVWKKDNLSGDIPTYTEFIEVLSDVDIILVRSSYQIMTDENDTVSPAAGAVTDLYSAFLDYATQDIADGEPINNIESCTCPPEYTGQFCELCAPGYKREVPNGGSLVACVECACNGHGTGDVPCEPETGVCNCTHHTTGDACELCDGGWFGTATAGTPADCQACMCPGDVVAGDLNVFAVTCELDDSTHVQVCQECAVGHGGDRCDVCLDQWYGTPEDPTNNNGACSSCVCNDRADTCNTTSGICEDCRNNTAGKECEICADTFTGNAMTDPCEECDCASDGATGQCNDRTGECECKPNVQNFECDQCVPNAYNYSSGEGCYTCDCDPIGSLGTGCDLRTGQCVCSALVTGRQCDRCQDTYWKLNAVSNSCDPCECTVEGTLPIQGEETFGTCDLESGQCTCKLPGIIGRTCDHCARGSVEEFTFIIGLILGEYPECELCGECYDSWARKADNVGIDVQTQYDTAIAVLVNYNMLTSDSVGPILETMQADLTSVQSSIERAQELVNKLNNLNTGFTQVSVDVANYTALLDEIDAAKAEVQTGLDAIVAFTGELQVSPVPILPSTLHNATLEEALLQTALVSAATTSWEAISQMSGNISDADGTVASLTSRVDAALVTLAHAAVTREQADNIIAGSFTVGFADNSEQLRVVESALTTLGAQVSSLQASAAATLAKVLQANATVHDAKELVSTRQAEMAQVKVNSQITKFNATTTLAATQEAKTAAVQYRDLATTAKQTITTALEDIVAALVNRTAIAATVTEYVATIATINGVTLRSLADLQIVTAQIESTTISADVEAVETRAQTNLGTANNLEGITELANEETGLALVEVENIQFYLADTTSTVTTINTFLFASAAANTTVNTAIEEALAKSSSAAELAIVTAAQEQALSSLIADKVTLHDALESTLAGLLAEAQAVDQLSQDAATIQAANHAEVDRLTNEVASDNSGLASTLTDLQELTDSMAVLEAKLQAVKDITDLQALLIDYNRQKLNMQTLENRLLEMDSEISTLLTELESLTDDTVCTYN